MATTETLYIESAASCLEKIDRYNEIITALEMRMVDAAAGNADIDEYKLNDGQVIIETKYRNPESIARAILMFKKLRNACYNELNGRSFVLRNWRGLTP